MKYSSNITKIAFSLAGINLGLGLLTTSTQAQNIYVDKQIILEVDVSGSFNGTDYGTIMNGYTDAFRTDPTIHELIEAQSDGVAVGLQFFASGQTGLISNNQNFKNNGLGIPAPISTDFALNNQWFVLYDTADAQSFADVLDGYNSSAQRPQTGTYRNDQYVDTETGTVFGETDLAPGVLAGNSEGCATEAYDLFGITGEGVGTNTNIAGAIEQAVCELNTATFTTNGNPNQKRDYLSANTTYNIIPLYESIIDISSDGIQNTSLAGNRSPGLDGYFGGKMAGANTSTGDFSTTYTAGIYNALGPNVGDVLGTTSGPNDAVALCSYSEQTINLCQEQLTDARSFASDPNTNEGLVDAMIPGGDTWRSVNRINGITIEPTHPTGNDSINTAYPNEFDYFDSSVSLTELNDSAANGISSITVGGVRQGDESFVQDANTVAGFSPAIIAKLENELEPVPFEFKPGFGLLIGVGIFVFKGWLQKGKELQKNKEKKEFDLEKNKNDKELITH